MKRLLIIAVLALVLLTVGAVAAFAAPGGPGWSMMGQGGYGHMRGSGMMGQGGYGMMGYGSMMGDDLEELLGISHEDIHAAHVDGKSLVEIAAEKGVTEDQLITALLDGRRTALDQAVKDGKLTQAAADQMLAFMETNIKAMVEAKGMSGMRSLMGGFGAMRGPGMMGWGQGQGASGAQTGPRTGGCHGWQAPAQQGTGNSTGSFRGVLQQG